VPEAKSHPAQANPGRPHPLPHTTHIGFWESERRPQSRLLRLLRLLWPAEAALRLKERLQIPSGGLPWVPLQGRRAGGQQGYRAATPLPLLSLAAAVTVVSALKPAFLVSLFSTTQLRPPICCFYFPNQIQPSTDTLNFKTLLRPERPFP
jgi:hypothetical protein